MEMSRCCIPYGPARKPWRETLSALAATRDGGTLLVTPPTFDPMTRPAKFPGEITAESYQVPSSGLSLEEQDSAMEETLEVMQTGKELMLGFMTSRDYESPRYLKSPLTNVMGNIPGDPFTVSIMFRKPNAQLVLKYTLMVTSLQIESKKEEFAQIYIMRHVTTEKFDTFVADLESPDVFPYKFNHL